MDLRKVYTVGTTVMYRTVLYCTVLSVQVRCLFDIRWVVIRVTASLSAVRSEMLLIDIGGQQHRYVKTSIYTSRN